MTTDDSLAPAACYSPFVSERLVLIGTSFRRIGFERLGRYVLPLDREADLAALRSACGARELVYVATCNRVEAYLSFASGDEARAAAIGLAERVAVFFAARGAGATEPRDLFVLAGAAALEHLFGVVASLDSLVLGECEIAGQVRRAAEAASAHGLCGRTLKRVFEQAARVARRVRSETAIGRTPVSVASLILKRMREHFAPHAPRTAVLIGVGDVTKKVAASLAGGQTELLFVNRTESRAAELAARHGGRAMSLEQFRATPPASIDLLVTATRAPGAIVDASTLAPALAAQDPGVKPILVCDLGVPADVDAAVDALPGVRTLRLPDLEATARENRDRLASEVERVKAIVSDEARRSGSEARLRDVAAESADALLATRLSHLAPDDREAVRRFATGLAERLARQP